MPRGRSWSGVSIAVLAGGMAAVWWGLRNRIPTPPHQTLKEVHNPPVTAPFLAASLGYLIAIVGLYLLVVTWSRNR